MEMHDEVKIIGPSVGGSTEQNGKTFRISQIQMELGHPNIFSARYFFLYPESSLELVSKPKTFQIGQKVRIIGPDVRGKQQRPIGTEFVISQSYETIPTSYEGCGPWFSTWELSAYPPSSLELVEEGLKIGDEVEVIGPSTGGWSGTEGQKFVITQSPETLVRCMGEEYSGSYSADGHYPYPASSLRKIPKADLKLSVTLDTSEFSKGIEKIQDRLWKIGIEQRLAAIEKLQGAQQNRMDSIETQLADLKDRTKYLEKKEEKQAAAITNLLFDRAKHNDRLCGLEKSVAFLESYQKSKMEMEARTSRFPKGKILLTGDYGTGEFASMLFNPSSAFRILARSLQEHETREAEKTKPTEPLQVGDWCQVMRSWERGNFHEGLT